MEMDKKKRVPSDPDSHSSVVRRRPSLIRFLGFALTLQTYKLAFVHSEATPYKDAQLNQYPTVSVLSRVRHRQPVPNIECDFLQGPNLSGP
jgi:hypothetical protein